MEVEFGCIEIRLNYLLEKKGWSKNKLSNKAQMSWKQVDNYCQNKVARLDTYALCKFCTVLECGIDELLVHHPAEEDK